MIGLGSIAQKLIFQHLQKKQIEFCRAFTPNAEKRNQICQQYRIQEFHSIETLASECDAIFVHSSTATHYEIVSELLKKESMFT